MAEHITEGRVRKLLVRNATFQDGGFYIAQKVDTDVKCQIYVFMRSKIDIKLDYEYKKNSASTERGKKRKFIETRQILRNQQLQ